MADIDMLLVGIWGDIKTAKTTFALTAPKPLFHMDLDLGFERAENRFESSSDIHKINSNLSEFLSTLNGIPQDAIITRRYPVPILWPGQNIQGMIALLETVTTDIGTAYMTPGIKSVVVDTGTVLWTVATSAHLERVQQRNEQRQRLQQIEYARPNAEMRALYGAARSYNTSLVITHHVGGVYKEQLGTQGIESMRVGDTWAGFTGMGGVVDIVGRTGITRNGTNDITPMMQVETCGYSLALEGQMLENPTFNGVLDTINNLRTTGV
jgi:hypothetical protein